jgi:Flp pilus assembly CpaF family ATPase
MTAAPTDITFLHGTEDASSIDWAVVRRIRRDVADRVSTEQAHHQQAGEPAFETDDQRMLGRAIIADRVGDWITERAARGSAVTPQEERDLTEAVFASIFGLGRLQSLIDQGDVENIDINGYDDVWISYADGRRVRGTPVAESDDELVEMVQSFAAWLGQTTREFSSAKPLLNLRLPDGSRLAAWMGVTPRPGLTIRRHRFTDLRLDDLAGHGTLDRCLVSFLRAAVRARKNIVVTGGVNAGKTTLLRALANEIDPSERLVVIEQEYELALDRIANRHEQVVSMEAREPNAEGAGGVTLAQLIVHALRMNPERIIVGEVRSDELIPMLTAMSSGNDGSLCSLHANSARAAFNRMTAIGLSSSVKLPVEATHLLIADAVDFVVHLVLDRAKDGEQRRYVSQVLEVLEVGERGRVTTNEVFHPGPFGVAVPGSPIRCVDQLERYGFDMTSFDSSFNFAFSAGQI